MKIIIVANVLVFILTDILVPFTKDHLILIKPLALTGDYWRFFTSMFAHGDITHLLFNMFCLYFFGQMTEYFFGSAKFLIIYILSGLVGAFASTLFSFYSSLGASGAVFGIVGANFYMLTKMDGIFKKKFKSDLIMFVVINLGISIYRSNIDLAAHVGGLVAGVLAGFALGDESDVWDKLRITKTVGLTALSLLFLVFTGFYCLGDSETQQVAIILRYETYGAKNALQCAEKARERLPKDPDIKELYYTLKYMVD